MDAILKFDDLVNSKGKIKKHPIFADMPHNTRRIFLLSLRDGKFCHYCGNDLYFAHDNTVENGYQAEIDGVIYTLVKMSKDYKNHLATIDHKIPRNNGGTNAWENLVLSCLFCNCQKGVKSYEDYKIAKERA